MNKINTGVVVFYILDCLFLILECIFNQMNGIGSIILSIIFSLLTILCSIILLILGIINFVKNKEKIVRKRLGLMLIVLILIGVIGNVVPKIVNKVLKESYKNKVVEMVEPLIDKIKDSDNGKYVYLLKDLKELDNSFDYKKFDDTSYITHFNNKTYVCMSNSKYKVDNFNGKYEITEILLFNKKCNYELDSEVAIEYAKDYLKSKYKELNIEDAKSIDNCEWDYLIPMCPDYKTIELSTNYGNVTIDVEFVDGEMKFDDNSDYVFSKLTNVQKLKGMIEYHATKYLNVEEIKLGLMIYDIYYSESTDIFFIGTSYEYEQAKEYAQSLGEYLQTKNLDAKVVIRKFIGNSIYEVEHEYAIPIQIEDGNLEIR